MKALVIYDTFFGNTEQIAKAIGNTLTVLAVHADVQILRVSEVKPDQFNRVELLLIGSPTRAFKATAPIMNLLHSLPRQGLRGIKAAAFDTRIPLSDINSAFGRFFIKRFGYAAEKIEKGLHKKGAELVAPAAGFAVTASEGPLKDGELQRAAHWLEEIVHSIAQRDGE